MFSRFAMATVIAFTAGPGFAAVCDPVDFETNIISCKNACSSSGHQPECNGSATMDTTSASDDADGIIRGFEVCHPDRGNKDKTKDEIAEACLSSNRQQVIDIARRVYGHPKPPPTPPQPVVKATDYNVRMFTANDTKQALIAEFDVVGNGAFQQITMSYHRDGKLFQTMTTYAVGAIADNGKFHIKITAYDYSVKDTTGYKYEVAGTVGILTPP